MFCKNKKFKDCLDKKTMSYLKGVAACVILIHHVSFLFDQLQGPLIMIRYISFPIVGYFFFASGYGLTYGLTRTDDYLSGFLHRHLLKIAIPYLITGISWIIIEMRAGGGVSFILANH